jgi:hypothetical protein
MGHALVLMGKCVRANMRWNLGQTIPARAGDPTADIVPHELCFGERVHRCEIKVLAQLGGGCL